MTNILDSRHVFSKFNIYPPYKLISGTGENVFETLDYSAVCIQKSAHLSRQKMWAKWSKSYWNRQQHKWLVPCDDIYWLSTFANKSCTVLSKHRKFLIFNQSHVHGDTVCTFILNHMMIFSSAVIHTWYIQTIPRIRYLWHTSGSWCDCSWLCWSSSAW